MSSPPLLRPPPPPPPLLSPPPCTTEGPPPSPTHGHRAMLAKLEVEENANVWSPHDS